MSSLDQNVSAATDVQAPDEATSLWLLNILYVVFSNYAWILPVGVGIPGNLLTLMVASLKHNRRLSPCVYMGAMAVADTCVLFSYGYFAPLWGFVRSAPLHWEYVHKCSMYLDSAFGMLSGLLLACMSVDRLIAIRFPMHAPTLCTTSRAKKIVVIATILTTLLNLYSFFVYEYASDPETGNGVLYLSVEDYPELEGIVSGFQLTFGTLCPFVVIFGSNTLIVISVRRAASERQKMEGQGQRREVEQKGNKHLTRMLMFVSLAYVVTSLPLRLFYVFMITPEVAQMYDYNDPYWNMLYNVLIFVLYFVWYCNFSVNYYMYILSGGKRYRNDAKKVLSCIFFRRGVKNRLPQPSAST